MAVIELRTKATARELRWFGLIMLLCFVTIGGLVYWRTGALPIALALWSIGGLLSAVYYALPPLRLPLYRAWMLAVFPIGWTVSHLILALAYFLLFTPIGLVMRLFGRDPMQRSFDAEARSYWIDRKPRHELSRYFRQF